MDNEKLIRSKIRQILFFILKFLNTNLQELFFKQIVYRTA
jgi:hypothetical protein